MMSNNLEFTPTIGIECHVQLNTQTKLFSGASNDARFAEPNTLVNHIDFGLPGALPVFNREALNLAIKAALALKTRPQLFSTFDRKHYFYPDLPMGYQITQYDQPIIIGGKVDFKLEGKNFTVRITRAHLEADAGKSMHPAGKDYSLVDLNRAGTPLLEIVSEPDMHSAKEAKAYAQELYLLMRYAGVTAGDLYHGNMRFDVNVSVSNNRHLGVRSETKNLNSFRSVEKAVNYEIKRQIDLIKSGKIVVQETRGWDEAKQKTLLQRRKENADDYRYMPDPDLPPLVIDDKYVNAIADNMPYSPDFWRAKLKKLHLSDDHIDVLINANIDFMHAKYLELIMEFDEQGLNATRLANWLVNIDIPLTKENKTKIGSNRNRLYKEVNDLNSKGTLSSTNLKQLITVCLSMVEPPKDIAVFAEKEGLIQSSDSTELNKIIEEVIRHNPKAVSDVRSGEQKAIGYLIGQVMQLSKGQANPELSKRIIEEKLK
jgi:aspartyl-tRNA(Asn)/glutamyl-tRNA(Gln) amidotransferase subunit B